MILDLKSVFVSEGADLPVSFELDMSDMVFSGSCPIKKAVAVDGHVSNRAGIVTIDLVCKVAYDAPCDRCGKDTVREYDVRINRVLVSQLADRTDDEIIEVPNMQLDVGELCTDEIVLFLPMKHLCKKDCKGVCQKCGMNLNDGVCGCKTDSHDPRLQALAQLLD